MKLREVMAISVLTDVDGKVVVLEVKQSTWSWSSDPDGKPGSIAATAEGGA
jgi:hypothetical protein